MMITEIYQAVGTKPFTAADIRHTDAVKHLKNLSDEKYIVKMKDVKNTAKTNTYKIADIYLKQFSRAQPFFDDPDLVQKIDTHEYTYYQLARDTGYSENYWRRYIRNRKAYDKDTENEK